MQFKHDSSFGMLKTRLNTYAKSTSTSLRFSNDLVPLNISSNIYEINNKAFRNQFKKK